MPLDLRICPTASRMSERAHRSRSFADNRGPDGCYVLDRHALVTFTLNGIMDLQLCGFSRQNVIGGLVLRRAPDRPDRRNYLTLEPHPADIEIELEPCFGLDGLVRARSVSIAFEPGKPNNQNA